MTAWWSTPRIGSGSVGDAGVPSGTHQYSVIEVNPSGQSSPASPPMPVTIVTTSPAAPTNPGLLAADDTGVQGDSITMTRRPRLTGNAAPGSTVQLLDPTGAVVASGSAFDDGRVVHDRDARGCRGDFHVFSTGGRRGGQYWGGWGAVLEPRPCRRRGTWWVTARPTSRPTTPRPGSGPSWPRAWAR